MKGIPPTDKQFQSRRLFTSNVKTKLPGDFIASQNEKYIIFDMCRVIYKEGPNEGKLLLDIDLHSRDFLNFHPDYDGYIMACNTNYFSPIKYKIDRLSKYDIDFFFMIMGTEPFDISKCKFFIEMTLIF